MCRNQQLWRELTETQQASPLLSLLELWLDQATKPPTQTQHATPAAPS